VVYAVMQCSPAQCIKYMTGSHDQVRLVLELEGPFRAAAGFRLVVGGDCRARHGFYSFQGTAFKVRLQLVDSWVRWRQWASN
jgi:hypothetical protein